MFVIIKCLFNYGESLKVDRTFFIRANSFGTHEIWSNIVRLVADHLNAFLKDLRYSKL